MQQNYLTPQFNTASEMCVIFKVKRNIYVIMISDQNY